MLTAVVLIAAAVAAGVAWDRLHIQPAPLNAAEPAAKNKPKAEGDKDRAADRDAVRAAFKDFVQVVRQGRRQGVGGSVDGRRRVSLPATARRSTAGPRWQDGYTQFFKKNPDVKLEFDRRFRPLRLARRRCRGGNRPDAQARQGR